MSTLTVADTILLQLGGNRFLGMTGAYNLLQSPNTLQFKVKTRAPRPNAVRITLDKGSDLYRVEFYRVCRVAGVVQPLEVYVAEAVFAEDLRRLFEDQTGLYTSL